MDNPNHPIWPLARMVLRAAVVALCLTFVYNKVDTRDLITIMVFALGDAGISGLVRPHPTPPTEQT